MNKNEILKEINSNISLLKKATNTLYHNKTYVVVNCSIESFFKTKRGAEGYIKRNKDFSYYDDYSQELIYPHKNDICVEILTSELKDIKKDKELWYNYLRSNLHSIMKYHMGQNILYTAKDAGVSKELMDYIEETIKDIEINKSMKVIDFAKEQTQTNLFKITSNQWEKTSKDYKSVINGVKYIYKNNELEPVEIDNINGNELRTYLFEECYITYSVLAWNTEDAEKIAKDCGHINVENLRLKSIEKENTNTITEKETQQQNSKEEDITESKQEKEINNINVSVNFNEEKNGIELHFTGKPSQEIREQIKSNGFRWSKYQKIWYSKDTEERREFLKSVGFLDNESNSNEPITVSEVEKNIKNVEYPTIDIDDIETYTVSKELSKRENSISMFRSKDTDHTKVLQHTLQSANDDVIKLIKMEGCTPYIEYKAKTMLQSFKKNYTNAYTSVLEHRANNPSWAVTGRGGLNVSRYNKKQNQLTNKMKHESELIHKFNYRIEQFQNQIRNNQKQKLKIELENNLNFIEQIPKFKRVKVKINGDAMADDNIFDLTNASYTKEKTGHQLDGYTIIKNWGCFRIYNPKGAEVWHTKTNENLDVAKKYVLYLLNQEQEKEAI